MNAVDTLGQTALHRAALAGHIQTCRLLLNSGADPSIVSLQGFTASQMGNEAVQQILNGEATHTHTYTWIYTHLQNTPALILTYTDALTRIQMLTDRSRFSVLSVT